MVAGYAWPWVSNKDTGAYDITIGEEKFRWNSVAQDWVNSKNAINEVGCIHTVQGYDLNYVGLIVGPELSYDIHKKRIIINDEHYHDSNGWRGVEDSEELRRYIINIYKTLATRGIKGAYMYFVDENLRAYVNSVFNFEPTKMISNIESPYTGKHVMLPLYDTVGCGDFMFADSNVQEMISIKESLVSKGSKYFILRASGDSMNMTGVHDGDLVLCRKNYLPNNGDRVVALVGDDATLKEFHKTSNSIILKPRSSNERHKELIFSEGDEIKIQGVMVRVLKGDDFFETS
jgi:SOS-response transcriptional repressor LexA